ncbi:MAG: TIGR03809 family protein [Tardiphaga sp.]
MSPHPNAATGRQLIERWAALAETRLDYLTELFESGRWRRFHTEADFLDNIKEARATADRWRAMANQEATIGNMPVTWSWLDRPEGVPSQQRRPIYEAPRPVAAPAVAAVELTASPNLQPAPTPFRKAAAAVDMDWQRALDPDVLGERYPMLRAAGM